MKNNISFYCLGAAHTDIKAHALILPKTGESIPVTLSTCLGGVACNLAVNLAHCGAQVALLSLVGHDKAGRALIEALRKKNIDTHDILFSYAKATAQYYALLTPQGELFIAGADMNIYQDLSAELIGTLLARRDIISDWVIDANLPAATISFVAHAVKKHQRLWGIGASAHKSVVLAHAFPRIYGLIINQEELFALTDRADPIVALEALRARQCRYVVVTMGALGVYYSDNNTINFCASTAIKSVDVTGAGDAFSAGLIYSLAHGQDIKKALNKGFSLAALALASCNSSLL